MVFNILDERLSAVMAEIVGRQGCAALVGPATDAKFGDYQANGVMALAKQLKMNPRELAEKIIEKLDVGDICERVEIAGPGFINFRLKKDFLEKMLLELNLDSARLGIEKTHKAQTVVVDFSCPNIAKQMHVGHLRSTIIGDCICRLLEFEGHKVIRQNHIGDWGLQMGMVAYSLYRHAFQELPREAFADTEWGQRLGTPSLATWEELFEDYPEKDLSDFVQLDLDNLENHYRRISLLEKENHDVAEQVREFTVKLHKEGSIFIRKLWEEARKITLKSCFEVYELLGKEIFREKDIRGESFYKDMLGDVVKELKDKGLAEESEGAVCVFPEGFKNKEGECLPFIIQKSDGAYLYATTDLAAIRYRIKNLKADKIIYVTDARQKLHFEMLFAVAKQAGWLEEGQAFHVTFGSVLGENGKPLKTREGENVKLKELLDEAVKRAREIVEQKNPELDEQKKSDIARAVGIGAVKYADFSNNRTSDYVFSFDKMLAMEGNTAPYMQYAYARIKSIEQKAPEKGVNYKKELAKVKSVEDLNLSEPAEIDLAKQLIRYGEVIEASLLDYRPNYLTGYLYELAQRFSGFYKNCPVLQAEPDKRPTRLMLCDLTAKTIGHGLGKLLGIEVVEQM